MGEGARNYSWPPAAEGNELALRHGAYSPRKSEPLAIELVERVLADPDVSYLQAPSYAAALWAWARAEAQVQLLGEYLLKLGEDLDPDKGGGLVDDKGEPRPALLALERAERRAVKARERLGLDPLSRAKLGKDVAARNVDLAKVFAQMQEEQSDDPKEDNDADL